MPLVPLMNGVPMPYIIGTNKKSLNILTINIQYSLY